MARAFAHRTCGLCVRPGYEHAMGRQGGARLPAARAAGGQISAEGTDFCMGDRFLQAGQISAGSRGHAASACAPAALLSQGSGRRGAGRGVLKIDSDSPERRHGAIPGTFPPHPVTLLAKQSRARKGLARGPWASCERELPEGGGADGQGPRSIATALPSTRWDPLVHISKHWSREGQPLTSSSGQGLFTVGCGSHRFWLQLTKFWAILSPAWRWLSPQDFGAIST